jgi:thiol:disulfide interchange protein DsbC
MNRNVSPLIAFAAFALAAGAPAFAQAPAPAPKPAAKAAAPAPTPDALAVKKIVEERFPGAQVKHIAKTAYFGGVYEVMFDDQMIYVDPKVNYLIVGQIYDAKTRTNLTERKVREINRIDFAELPLDLAIKKVKGNGTRKLAVFSDADCPFCARLEQALKDIDDVTIYTFLYPIDQLHPDAARKSRVIWCSPDRTKSWDEFFANGTLPPNAGDCDNPIAATQALGQKLRVSATPTLVFADGSIVPGALPKESLEGELKRADSEMRKVAATR